MRILLGVVLALIVYGSFFPFDYEPHAASLADLRHLAEWPSWVSLVDAVGNMLLFVPLGLVLTGLRPAPRAHLAWLSAGMLLAWTLQYFQFWFPSRDPSGSDAWFNTAGLLLGAAFGLRLRHAVATHARRLAATSVHWPIATTLLLLWLVCRWFPLLPHLSLEQLLNHLGPLLSPRGLPLADLLHDTAGWLLCFFLLRLSPWPELSHRTSAALSLAVLGLEPFFWFSYLSLAQVAGLALALALRPWWLRGPGAEWRLLALVLAAVLVRGFTPWPSASTPQPFLWIPFAGMLYGNMIGNTAVLLDKCFLYGGAILLLGLRGVRLPLAGAMLALVLAGIEAAQRFSPTRTPELTDPVLALLLGCVLHAVWPARSR